jgi:hypothetical protein
VISAVTAEIQSSDQALAARLEDTLSTLTDFGVPGL